MINIGRILRSQGRDGELKLQLYHTDTLEFPELRRVFIGKEGALREFQIQSLIPRGRACHLKLEGVDSLPQADRLAGLEVFVPEEALKSLTGDQYYHYQLIGCSVRTADGEPVGTVADMLSVEAGEILVVDRFGREILVPFHADICRTVDVAKKEIVIDPPDGLLDLNEI